MRNKLYIRALRERTSVPITGDEIIIFEKMKVRIAQGERENGKRISLVAGSGIEFALINFSF